MMSHSTEPMIEGNNNEQLSMSELAWKQGAKNFSTSDSKLSTTDFKLLAKIVQSMSVSKDKSNNAKSMKITYVVGHSAV